MTMKVDGRKEIAIRGLAESITNLNTDPRYSAGLYFVNTSLLLNKYLDQVLSAFNLNGPRIRVLFTLTAYGGTMKAKDMTKWLVLSKQGTSKIIDSLIKDGLVSKRKDELDRRSFKISITKKGIDTATASLPVLITFNHLTMGLLSEDDTEVFKHLLKKIRKSLHKQLVNITHPQPV